MNTNHKLVWLGKVNATAASILIDDNKIYHLSYDAGDHFSHEWQSGDENFIQLERDIWKTACISFRNPPA